MDELGEHQFSSRRPRQAKFGMKNSSVKNKIPKNTALVPFHVLHKIQSFARPANVICGRHPISSEVHKGYKSIIVQSTRGLDMLHARLERVPV